MNKKLISYKFPQTSLNFSVNSPANGKKLASLPIFDANQVQSSIKKVVTGFENWSNKTAFERARILHKWHDLILANKQDLAKIMSAESAKLMEESLLEVEFGASFVSWCAEEAKRAYGEIIPMPNGNRGEVHRQPIGAVAAITPWNFPLAMITRKVAPALAAGCSVVCKPSELTPLSAIALLNLAREAGIEDGVFELVFGDASMIGKEFCASPALKKLSFTGSTRVGKILMEQCAAIMKKVTMELGGNAPFIVFDDANLDLVVAHAVKSRFRFSGQTCICANRFLIQEGIYAEFVKKFAAAVKKIEIAPLINSAAAEKVSKLVEGCKKEGGKVLYAAKGKAEMPTYYPPTIIEAVTEKMEIFAAEIFGPVATLVKFKTAKDAVKLANATSYGLAAYVFGTDLRQASKVAEQLEFGMVGINESAISASHSPFGGMKESGIGREGSHYGIEEYFETKFVSINLM